MFLEPRLIAPNAAYAQSYADALAEGLGEAPATQYEIDWIREDFADWLRAENDMTRRIVTPDGTEVARVPFTNFWLVAGQEFIGRINIRHHLNSYLEQEGGHVGYAIRTSARGKGYGHMILRLALPELKKLGISKALITCDDTNAPSARIIEKAGGKLQDTITVAGHPVPVRRYWLTL